MPRKDLDSLIADQESYDKESQTFLHSLKFAEKQIGDLNSMKRTSGWKLLEKKIREQLQSRILEMVKEDSEVNTLLALLNVADTKTMEQQLEEEIQKILPEQSG